MIIHQTKIEHDLEEFRKKFRSIKVMVHKDFMVYSYNSQRDAVMCCAEANLLINQLKLDLVAIFSHNTQTFHVQSNEYI